MGHLTDLPAITNPESDITNVLDRNQSMISTHDRIKDPSISNVHISKQIDSHQRSKWYHCILGDIYATDDPNDYSRPKKNVIILLVALGGIAGPMSSMMYMPGLLEVARDLNTTTSAVNGTISAFVVFMGISVSPFFIMSELASNTEYNIISHCSGLH